jgi:hypothetical protein
VSVFAVFVGGLVIGAFVASVGWVLWIWSAMR